MIRRAYLTGLLFLVTLPLAAQMRTGRVGDRLKLHLWGKISGREIYDATFNDRVGEEIALIHHEDSNAAIDTQAIRRAIWSRLVDETAIWAEANRRGIAVGYEELIGRALADPPRALRPLLTDSAGIVHEEDYRTLLRYPRQYLLGRNPRGDQFYWWEKRYMAAMAGIQLEQVRLELARALFDTSSLPDPPSMRMLRMDRDLSANALKAMRREELFKEWLRREREGMEDYRGRGFE